MTFSPKRIHQFTEATVGEFTDATVFEVEVPDGYGGWINRKVPKSMLPSGGGGSGSGQIINCGARIGSGGEQIICGSRV